ncbi:hypothetical protein JCM3765_003034 [Sporobolomyces pararoseus]
MSLMVRLQPSDQSQDFVSAKVNADWFETTAATVRWEKYLGKPNIVVPDNFQHSLGVAPSASRLGRRHAAIYGHRI